MNIHRTIRHLTLVCLLSGAPASRAAEPVANEIVRLRSQREKAIAEAIAKANVDYANGVDRLKSLYPSKPEVGAMIAREKEELAKVSLVTLPPVVRIATEIAGAAAQVPHQRPSIQKPDDLARYLIGTRWSYYGNDKFMGDAKTLVFTGPGAATINGSAVEWKVLDKVKIWTSGNREFTFNKQFDEFSGGWVPNPKDRNSGRLIK